MERPMACAGRILIRGGNQLSLDNHIANFPQKYQGCINTMLVNRYAMVNKLTLVIGCCAGPKYKIVSAE
jgi:hypothetical protein